MTFLRIVSHGPVLSTRIILSLAYLFCDHVLDTWRDLSSPSRVKTTFVAAAIQQRWIR